MAKAKAGQSAKKRQERERRSAEHREMTLANLPDRPDERHDQPSDATPHGAGRPPVVDLTRPDDDPVQERTATARSEPVSGAEPEVQPGPDRAITAPTAGVTSVVVDAFTASADPDPTPTPGSGSGSDSTFAPVPRVPAAARAPGATSMATDPTQPRGRMTDRYTVWSRAASRPAGADAQPPAESRVPPPAAGPATASAATPDSGAAPSSSGTTAQSVSEPRAAGTVSAAASRGVDLARSRLRIASTAAGPTSGTADATTADDIGSAEAALDDAVDHVIATTEAVEAILSDQANPAGATIGLAGADSAAESAPRSESGDGAAHRAEVTAEQVANQTDGATADVMDAAGDGPGRVSGAGSDIADSVKGALTSAHDDLTAAAGPIGEQSRTAGEDVAAAVEDGLDEAGDRVGQAAGQIADTAQTAARDATGTVGRTIHDVREQVVEAAQDLLAIGRDSFGDVRTVAADATADVRSGIADAAGSIAGTGRAAAGRVTGRANDAADEAAGISSGSAPGVTGTVGSGMGQSASTEADATAAVGQEIHQDRRYDRLIVSAIAIGTVSGLNRWAIRRLTGADIAILGPSTVHPAILGTGLAALIASLYMTEDSSSGSVPVGRQVGSTAI